MEPWPPSPLVVTVPQGYWLFVEKLFLLSAKHVTATGKRMGMRQSGEHGWSWWSELVHTVWWLHCCMFPHTDSRPFTNQSPHPNDGWRCGRVPVLFAELAPSHQHTACINILTLLVCGQADGGWGWAAANKQTNKTAHRICKYAHVRCVRCCSGKRLQKCAFLLRWLLGATAKSYITTRTLLLEWQGRVRMR